MKLRTIQMNVDEAITDAQLEDLLASIFTSPHSDFNEQRILNARNTIRRAMAGSINVLRKETKS
jgi:hypothetical protein